VLASLPRGILYYITFAVLMVLILLNFLIAILSDSYSEVKNESKAGPARYCSPRHRVPCNSINQGPA
jgi:hypothetical protein